MRLDTYWEVVLDITLFQISIRPYGRWIRKDWRAPTIESWQMWLILGSFSLKRVIQDLVFEGLVHQANVKVIIDCRLGFAISSSYCQVKYCWFYFSCYLCIWNMRLFICNLSHISATVLNSWWSDATKRRYFTIPVILIWRTPLWPVCWPILRYSGLA